jgi:hypothetical protein
MESAESASALAPYLNVEVTRDAESAVMSVSKFGLT